jgi:hypothetical protein
MLVITIPVQSLTSVNNVSQKPQRTSTESSHHSEAAYQIYVSRDMYLVNRRLKHSTALIYNYLLRLS